MKNIILAVAGLTLVFNCKDHKAPEYTSVEKIENNTSHPGKKLMETNCYVCHSPTASHDDRIAPPMIAVKKHYLKEGMTKEQFIGDMQEWIKNPTEENAKMFGAVKRFGLMPKQIFPKETIKQIADYMFDYDIEQPEWFEEHFNSEKGKHQGQGQGMGKGKGNGNGKMLHKQQVEVNFNTLPYAERGLNYALSTKAVLGKNLMTKLQKNGTIDALKFCNTKAYPLTDSMAVVHNAEIKRVTDKPRNLNNQANSTEKMYINTFKELTLNGEEIEPIVKEVGTKVQVYYPIITNTMCLQCHGKPNDMIKKETMNAIAQLYPNDEAIGYDINEVRGIWRISFEQ